MNNDNPLDNKFIINGTETYDTKDDGGGTDDLESYEDLNYNREKSTSLNNTHILEDKDSDAYKMRNESSFKRALKRIFALFLTFIIEMVVAFVISNYTNTFNKYPLLISFQPVISAVSGNVGLQSSSINVRGIETKHSELNCKSVGREVLAGLWLAMFTCLLVGITAGAWYTIANQDIYDGAIFGIAIGVGQFCASLAAAASGSFAPILFKRWFKCDPTTMAGPMETAFQDVIGGTLLLVFSSWLLSSFGHIGNNCWGGNWTMCGEHCLNSTTYVNGTFTKGVQDCFGDCNTYC